MRKLLFLLLIPIMLCGATFYSWRYREHAVDCTAITDGRTRDLCFEIDDEKLFKCEPDVPGGVCDTVGEWKEVTTSPVGSDKEIQFNDNGVFGSDSRFTIDKVLGWMVLGGTLYSELIQNSDGITSEKFLMSQDKIILNKDYYTEMGGGGYLAIGVGYDLQLYHDDPNSYIVNNSGILYIVTDTLSISGPNDSQFSIKTITEEVTIAIGDGFDPVVVTSSNLAPAGSLIVGVSFRITDAPGGGATVIDIGRTNGSNLDEFIDGASCDVLDEVGNNYTNGDTAHIGIQRNVSADTFTLTLDADVTGDEMKVRIVVFYRDLIAPTS